MKFYESNNKIYAYYSGVTVLYNNGKWEISSKNAIELEHSENISVLSYNEAMVVVNGNDPLPIITQYLDYLKNANCEKVQ